MNSLASLASIMLNDELITIADIGASLEGNEVPMYQGLIDSGKARLMAFEPDTSALQALREKYPAPHVCLPLFIGDGQQKTFYQTNWGPTGSFFEPNMPLLRKFHNLAEISTVVKTWSVDSVKLDDVSEIEDVDFIKADAQGAELMIFQNSPRILSGVSLIHTEVSFVELYKGMPLVGDVDQLLRSMGFQWQTLLGTGRRPFVPFLNPDHWQSAYRQDLWGDVLYVRDWMTFDRVPARKLIKLAVLLSDLYGSYDLAYVALAAADKQMGTTYSGEYAKLMI